MTRMRTPLAAAALATALLGGCLDTPSDPTWVEDVRPIIMANCVRCHGTPPLSQAPSTFRLDAYGSTYLPGSDDTVDGAADVAGAGTMVDEVVVDVSMPPRFPLTQRQRDIIEAWSDADDPDAERPGPPRSSRSDNHPPEVEISGLFIDARGAHAEVWLHDEDPEDYVTGMLYAVPVDEGVDAPLLDGLDDRKPRKPFGLQLFDEGPATLAFTTDQPLFDRTTATHYDLFLEIDDGIDAVTIDLGFIELATARRQRP
jgi:hypothetical protein